MQTLQQLQNGELKGTVRLKLSEGLMSFPQEIFDLADTLEILDLSRNKLSALPADLGRLRKLRILFCSENLFTELPCVLGDCPALDIVGFKANMIETVPSRSLNTNLRWLILTDNRIKELPETMGNCSRMQKLMLAGNRLASLPESLSLCRNLSLLRISANMLTALPEWLLTMPKLSWLAFSGNAFNKNHTTDEVRLIDWNELKTAHVLGEGASGIIYRAHLGERDVAVKIFKGSVTSDGLPEDELNVCIAAGAHDGLIQLIGQVVNHPENRHGLVMALIPEHFANLGLPPTFESCTRDVFPANKLLTPSQVLRIVTTIASVAAQLHSKGIMHGDMYAHNILTDNEGHPLLGDFGAATFYDRANKDIVFAMERLEVSAYGYLLEDLLSICIEAKTNKAMLKIGDLKEWCIAPDKSARPSFEKLVHELSALNIQQTTALQ